MVPTRHTKCQLAPFTSFHEPSDRPWHLLFCPSFPHISIRRNIILFLQHLKTTAKPRLFLALTLPLTLLSTINYQLTYFSTCAAHPRYSCHTSDPTDSLQRSLTPTLSSRDKTKLGFTDVIPQATPPRDFVRALLPSPAHTIHSCRPGKGSTIYPATISPLATLAQNQNHHHESRQSQGPQGQQDRLSQGR